MCADAGPALTTVLGVPAVVPAVVPPVVPAVVPAVVGGRAKALISEMEGRKIRGTESG